MLLHASTTISQALLTANEVSASLFSYLTMQQKEALRTILVSGRASRYPGKFSSVTTPINAKTFLIWSLGSPGNSILLVITSAIMQPIDHMSTSVE
jgi:hypothetical protein